MKLRIRYDLLLWFSLFWSSSVWNPAIALLGTHSTRLRNHCERDVVLGLKASPSTSSEKKDGISLNASETIQNSEDDFFREFRRKVPTQIQHLFRDSGVLRTIVDTSVLLAIQPLLDEHPSALGDFLRLTGQAKFLPLIPEIYQSETKLTTNVSVQKLRYGPNPRQFLSLLEPDTPAIRNSTIIFVHGGAWGSGFPEMYQLVATPFLNQGFRVAVLGYRTYPTTDCKGQMDDLSNAIQHLQDRVPEIGSLCWIGHSSGAHISSLAFATCRIQPSEKDRFISLAGVFDIPEHYRFEKTRGVERFSPLAAACGAPGSRLAGWKENSPLRVVKRLPETTLPLSLIVHGEPDTTVPWRSSENFAAALSETTSVEFRLLPTVGHADMVTDLMFGGVTQDVVLDWILLGES